MNPEALLQPKTGRFILRIMRLVRTITHALEAIVKDLQDEPKEG